ncbi:PEP-CTERM sorting domain-containing protein [Fortiea sp. LEGE XX443]|nr:PEP-CTERM sorting domain-containing protein [Fortiea sp. LEGE XX443]
MTILGSLTAAGFGIAIKKNLHLHTRVNLNSFNLPKKSRKVLRLFRQLF